MDQILYQISFLIRFSSVFMTIFERRMKIKVVDS